MYYIIGIDEAGRGPWAGPVVVGGFLIQKERLSQIFGQLPKLDDSKKLSHGDRESLFHDIERLQFERECQYAFAYREAESIDALGIRETNRQCMQDVIASLLQFVDVDDSIEIWIDGCDNYRFDGFDSEYIFAKRRKKNITAQHSPTRESIGDNPRQILTAQEGQKPHSIIHYVIHGDSLVPAISAASIIAKVVRDRMMCEFDADFPEYGFRDHKGYGTKKHQEALLNHGITSIHRKSYAPVKRLISSTSSV